MDALKALYGRKSTKNFNNIAVPDEIIEKITAAAMCAPIGMARYDTVHLTVIKSQALLKEISENSNMATAERPNAPLYGAPTLIIVSVKMHREDHIEFANCGCVMENMAIAATALNVGSVYLWGFLRTVRSNTELLKKLELPSGFTPVSALAIGYPLCGKATADGENKTHDIGINVIN